MRMHNSFGMTPRGFALAFLGVMCFAQACKAQVPHEVEGLKPACTIPYRLLQTVAEPKAGQAKRPLIIYLHGAGERGTDNTRQMGNIQPVLEKALTAAYVLAPQCPEGQKWADVDWAAPSSKINPAPSPSLAAVWQLVNALVKAYPIDTNRIYITGLSMGGFGTWDALSRWPWRFAAGVPICGGGDESQAPRIAPVPVWAFHGAADPLVSVERTRRMIAALKANQASPHYTEYPKVGHAAWVLAYRNEDMLAWLFQQVKAPHTQTPTQK